MTTTTDTGPDVQVSHADTGEIFPTEVRDRVDQLGGAATDGDLQTLLQHNHVLRAELERTKAELAALQATVSPLEAGWTPPTEKPTAWIEEQTIAHRAAEHRPTADTHSYTADLHKQDRERWDSVHDDIETLSAHEPADVWDDALRALTAERVQVDYSYRQSEAWALADMVVGQSRQRDSVYAELAPENIQQSDVPMIETSGHERQPEDRAALDRMVKRVPTVISAQRPPRDTSGDVSLADYVNAIEAAEAVGVTVPPAPTTQVAASEPTYNETASELGVGTVRASRWARLTAWFGGATTRRRQTEQDGGEA